MLSHSARLCQVIPPPNAYGTDEDSLSSVLFLQPRVPKREPQRKACHGSAWLTVIGDALPLVFRTRASVCRVLQPCPAPEEHVLAADGS
jgi:hypothetical protein